MSIPFSQFLENCFPEPPGVPMTAASPSSATCTATAPPPAAVLAASTTETPAYDPVTPGRLAVGRDALSGQRAVLRARPAALCAGARGCIEADLGRSMGRGGCSTSDAGQAVVTLPLAHLFSEASVSIPTRGCWRKAHAARPRPASRTSPGCALGPRTCRRDSGSFRVATFAQSFHWMDRDRVAALVLEMLEPGGALVHISDCQGRRGTGSLRRRAPSPVAAISRRSAS